MTYDTVGRTRLVNSLSPMFGQDLQRTTTQSLLSVELSKADLPRRSGNHPHHTQPRVT